MMLVDAAFSLLLLAPDSNWDIASKVTTQRNYVIRELPQPQSLKKRFQLLLWNIQKGTQKQRWAQDFHHLNQNADLTLIQEAMVDQFVDQVFKAQEHQSWYFSKSFVYQGSPTGVASGCRCQFQEWDTEVSPGREPVAQTPKVTQVAKVPLTNGQILLTLNIHAINFVPTPVFKAQIDALIPIIQQHNGPVIFAGDFNTWNPARMHYLNNLLLGQLGFSKVDYPTDPRWLKLDHIYLRGCDWQTSEILNQIHSSDHYPIEADIQCD